MVRHDSDEIHHEEECERSDFPWSSTISATRQVTWGQHRAGRNLGITFLVLLGLAGWGLKSCYDRSAKVEREQNIQYLEQNGLRTFEEKRGVYGKLSNKELKDIEKEAEERERRRVQSIIEMQQKSAGHQSNAVNNPSREPKPSQLESQVRNDSPAPAVYSYSNGLIFDKNYSAGGFAHSWSVNRFEEKINSDLDLIVEEGVESIRIVTRPSNPSTNAWSTDSQILVPQVQNQIGKSAEKLYVSEYGKRYCIKLTAMEGDVIHNGPNYRFQVQIFEEK
jgi:hypothetical protein